jgi:hypothetical protein
MDSYQSPSKPTPKAPGLISAELLLSLTTGSVLLALVAGKVLSEAVCQLGLLSEEIFRGDRLPVLNFPANSSDPTSESTDSA